MENDIFVTLWQSPQGLALLWLAIANLAAFFLFGLDKWKAKRKARRPHVMRIRERTLLLWALAGGSAGAILGMRLFRHKTRKALFAVGLPLILLAQAALGAWIYFRFFR
jgi:uncharacterized membrane protein YsdA (DUF1294 family)